MAYSSSHAMAGSVWPRSLRVCGGAGEEGVDAGGLTKEFFALLIERLFDPQFGMFVLNEETR